MATIQDYREARRTGQISLTNLIARNIAEGGGFGSVGRAISQKIKARGTRIKEAFDPLNIASMLVGRTKLGTAILGRMMGRSAEDIQYFARKGAGRDAAYDPFFARSPRSLQPVRQNESMADIYAKLYALIKKQIEEENKRKQTEKNFQEEREIEDERRHKEMLVAIRGKGKGKATPVDKKEGGGLFDLIKGMFAGLTGLLKNLKTGLLWLFAAMTPIITMLGKGLMAIFEAMIAAGKSFLSFLASPAGFITAIATAQVASALKLTSDVETKIEKAAEKGDIGTVTTEIMKRPAAQSALGAEFQDPMKFSDARTETRKELKAAADKGSPEAKSALQKFDKEELTSKYAEDYLRKKGYEVDEGGVYLATKKGTSILGFGGEKVPRKLAEEALTYGRKKAESESKATPVPKKATPSPETKGTTTPTSSPAPAAASAPPAPPAAATPASSLPSTPPVVTATGQNMELESESMYSMQSAPMIFNKNATTGVNLGGQDTGTATGAAPIRDDAIEDIINKLQRRSSVM
jgi:hypothetical protein